MNSLQISQATDMFKKSHRKERLQFSTESVLKSEYLEKGCSSSLGQLDGLSAKKERMKQRVPPSSFILIVSIISPDTVFKMSSFR